MRILHLVEPPAPGLAGAVLRPAPHDAGALACRAAIEKAPEHEHRVCLIGPASAEHRAHSLGLRTTDRISPPLGVPSLAWFGLESLVRDRGPPDAVQCWSRPLLRLARLALGNAVVCVGPPDDYPIPLSTSGTRREELRRRFGLADGEKAVLLLADPPSLADARRFVFTLGLTEVAGFPCAGVIPAGARFLVRGRRFCRDAHLGGRLVFTDLPAWTLAPACDAALLHAAGDEPAVRCAPPEAPAIARAAAGGALLQGVPVIAPQSAGAEPWFDTAAAPRCLAASAKAPHMAARLVGLFSDAGSLEELSRHLKARVHTMVSGDRTVAALATRWARPQVIRGATSGATSPARPGAVA